MPFNPFEFHEGMEAIPEGVMNDLENEVARLSKLHAIPPLVLRNDGTGPALGIKLPRDRRFAKVGSGGIPGRVGTTLGRGAITFQDVKQTGSGATITAAFVDGDADNAYNEWFGWISANAIIALFRYEGLWYVAEPEPIHVAVLTGALATGTLAAPASANATLYRGSGSGVQVSTGQSITVYNTMALTASVPIGKQIDITQKGDTWLAITREC
jgi:hypothetical protein